MNFDLGLRGRAAVVAGGPRGVGRATADLLAGEGCRVAVLARTEVDLRETEDELLAAGAPGPVCLQTGPLHPRGAAGPFPLPPRGGGQIPPPACTAGPPPPARLTPL